MARVIYLFIFIFIFLRLHGLVSRYPSYRFGETVKEPDQTLEDAGEGGGGGGGGGGEGEKRGTPY